VPATLADPNRTGGSVNAWLVERVEEIRARITAADEASLWTLFFSELTGEPAVASAIDGAMNEMDLELLRRLVEIADGVGAEGCLFAVIRHEGRPQPVDLQAWRDLRVLLRGATTRVLGFVVVGATLAWSPGEGDDDLGNVA
jgi:hypothetical protein